MSGDAHENRAVQLLRQAEWRGLIASDQVDLCLRECPEDPAAEAVRRGFLSDGELTGIALMGAILQEPAPPAEQISPDFWNDISGKQFGRYQLEGLVGQGASALVIRARDEVLKRIVALKVLREGALAGANGLERFSREAKIMAQLSHPHIVKIHDIGCESGWYYICMEFIEGRSLENVFADAAVPLAKKLEMISKVARACHAAHEQGIVHRDLKPENILVDGRMEPFVTDFGVARLTREEHPLTKTGAVIGTAAYMSPEHVAGTPASLDARSDVFSLGAILYEAVARRLPFPQSDMAPLFQAIRGEDPEPLHSVDPSIPKDLEAVVFKALAKKPSDRYASSLEMAEDLDRYLAGHPVKATRLSTLNVWLRGLRRRAGLAAVIALALLSSAAGGWWVLDRAREAERRETLRPQFEKAREKIEEARRLRGEARSRARGLALEAFAALRAVVTEDPGYVDAWIALARAQQLLARNQKALRILDEAILHNGETLSLVAERSRISLMVYAAKFKEVIYAGPGTPWTLGTVWRPSPANDPIKAVIQSGIDRLRRSESPQYRNDLLILDGALAVISGKTSEGLALLDQAVEADRHDILARFFRARANLIGGRLDDAERDLNFILDGTLADATDWILRGYVHWGQGKREDAVSDFEHAIESDPSDPEAHFSLGRILMEFGRLTEAQKRLTEAIRLAPNSSNYYNSRGNARRFSGDGPGALADFDAALRLKPGTSLYLQNRGVAHLDAKNFAEALEDLDRAIEIDPESSNARSYRAAVKEAMGDFEGAREDHDWAVDKNPSSAIARCNRGLFFLRTNRLSEAANDAEQAIKLDPRLVDALLLRGNIAFARQNYDAAAQDYQKAIDVDGSPLALNGLAGVRMIQGDNAAAEKLIDECLRKRPDLSQALWRKGVLRKSSPRETLDWWKKSVEAEPGNYERLLACAELAFALSTEGPETERSKLRSDARHYVTGALKCAPADWKLKSKAAALLASLKEADY
jgi:tetratricopeptide (TPR) repeat protein/tRNA A-37 threonylcarbamoyl transferase component Bud32